MASWDVLEGDAFKLVGLTESYIKRPVVPGKLGQLGIFAENGVQQTTVYVEAKAGKLSLVPSKPRGASGTPVYGDKSKLIPLSTLHLPQSGFVEADAVQNVRKFGTESEAAPVESLVNEQLAEMAAKDEATKEWGRVSALQGVIRDANGEIITDYYERFGATRKEHEMEFGTTANKKIKVIEAKRMIEDDLGMLMYTGIRCYMSRGFHDAMMKDDEFLNAWNLWQEGRFHREDQRGGFVYMGVTWEEYHAVVSNQHFIPADGAVMFPVGVPRMFRTVYAPANYRETVQTIGLPRYAKMRSTDFDKGVEIEGQSNPLTINLFPGAVVHLSK